MARKITIKVYEYGEPVPEVGAGYQVNGTFPVHNPQQMGTLLTTLFNDQDVAGVRLLKLGNDKASVMQFISSCQVQL